MRLRLFSVVSLFCLFVLFFNSKGEDTQELELAVNVRTCVLWKTNLSGEALSLFAA